MLRNNFAQRASGYLTACFPALPTPHFCGKEQRSHSARALRSPQLAGSQAHSKIGNWPRSNQSSCVILKSKRYARLFFLFAG